MKLNVKSVFVCAICALVFASCATGPEVSRVDASTVTDLTGYWNDTDVDKVCKDLITKFLESPRVSQFTAQKKRLPVIRLGNFKNASSEPIDTSIISKRMQVQILNSGKAEFVADSGVSQELRVEAEEQSAWATDSSQAQLMAETGADFLLTGAVKTVIQTAGNQQVRAYVVNADATDITTHRIIWSEENNEIKKVVVKSGTRF
jgi:PBP1b-binding outer membrane lipoprotein LpoB